MQLNNIIFSFLLLLFVYSIAKYFLHFFNKSKINLLSDNQFNKPQAFHEIPTYRLGGSIIFLSLIIVFLYLFFFQNIFYIEYISFCTFFFILGFVDDLKIYIKPKFRLFIMFVFLLTLIIFNEFKIERIDLEYLDDLMKIDIFGLFFICFCFLFIINGANLIDGFNGLLSIHALIILLVLSYINLVYEKYNLAYFLFYTSLIIIIFIKFNFPKALLFLGDSGAYLIGSLVAISTIITNNLNPSISSFFFCIILFYLFFEVFFSFFRKIFFTQQSPLLPDNKHLHMLIYKLLLKKNKKRLKSNYETSIYINLIYLLLLIPAFVFMNNGVFCRYYFFFLIILYTYIYKMLNSYTE